MVNGYGFDTDAVAVVATRILATNPTSATENINGMSTPGLLLGGSYSSDGAHSIGNFSTNWSRTIQSYSHGYGMSVGATVIYLPAHDNRRDGRSVRCLAQ